MAEELVEDQASWTEIVVTCLLTGSSTSLFLIVFEVARRNPLVSSLFDSRRKAKPKKTPPPLTRSRIFEWLFLSTDPAYTEIAQLSFKKEVIKERRRQQKVHASKRLPPSKGSQERSVGVTTILEENEEDVEKGKKPETGQEESDSSHGDDAKTRSVSNDISELDCSTEDNVSFSSGKTRRSVRSFFPIGSGNKSDTSRRSDDSLKRKREIRRTNSVFTPDIVTISGRRLPASVAEYAIAGDLTDEQLDHYESDLIAQEKEEEKLFKKKARELVRKNGYTNRNGKKTNDSFDDNDDDNDDALTDLKIPFPPHYLANFGIENSGSIIDPNSFLGRFFNKKSKQRNDNDVDDRGKFTKRQSSPANKINRQLNTTKETEKRKLSMADKELLRFIGLDTFVMIRFLRFGFRASFYPFLAACVILIPTYYTHNYVPPAELPDDFEEPLGYFQITMNRLEANNSKHWISWIFAILFHLYILRLVWIEWEFFLPLRFDFLAHGQMDKGKLGRIYQNAKDNKRLHLQQFQNSCMVEFIPESHRRDQELYHFFDALFPNGIKRAEVLINASKLTELTHRRVKLLAQYERVYAKQYNNKQCYRRKMENYQDSCKCLCFGGVPQKPKEIKINIKDVKKCICRNQKSVLAAPYLLQEIRTINIDIEKEHRRIIKEKKQIEDKHHRQELFTAGISNARKFVTGVGGGLNCDTGFVEFKNLTLKQTALQCNLSGTANCMVMSAAPDPRDVIWSNMTVKLKYIKMKKVQIKLLLTTGLLFWSAVVTGITSISNLDRLSYILPSWLIPKPGTFWYGLIQGYLPVVFLELLMIIVPVVLGIIAKSFIGLKTKSEVDGFVFIWHFGFRIANLLIIIFKNQLFETLVVLRHNPELALASLTRGVSVSSQFFLNNIIVTAGSETFELAQITGMVRHLVLHTFVTLEAKSQRDIEKLNETQRFYWGEVVPPFIFAFLVAVVYSTTVPLMLGGCAFFFFIATKVYTHQALFVYSQPYEGGGTLMYKLNRSIFVILYLSVFFFSAVLGLKEHPGMASSFLFFMSLIIILVDRKIVVNFVLPSRQLALTHARMIDELTYRSNQKNQDKIKKLENIRKRGHRLKSRNKTFTTPLNEDDMKEDETVRQQREKSKKMRSTMIARSHDYDSDEDSDESTQADDTDFYIYRQPQLSKSSWETKPRPYR